MATFRYRTLPSTSSSLKYFFNAVLCNERVNRRVSWNPTRPFASSKVLYVNVAIRTDSDYTFGSAVYFCLLGI
jgi:hypothetical protein